MYQYHYMIQRFPSQMRMDRQSVGLSHVQAQQQKLLPEEMSQEEELDRRFHGSITGSPTGTIIWSFHSLTVCANRTSTPNPEAEEAVHVLCDFYEKNEDQLKTELKVFHSSFPLKNLQEILTIVEENTGQLIFPTFVKMVKIYATLPVTTASVERSFSKLKIIKNRLRSLCGEDRLSDLVLLAIEQDIQINHSEVINILQEMAPRRMLL
ncbi:hypothetical protein MHYP_G00121350 [Metynnis hypsauchen]